MYPLARSYFPYFNNIFARIYVSLIDICDLQIFVVWFKNIFLKKNQLIEDAHKIEMLNVKKYLENSSFFF